MSNRNVDAAIAYHDSTKLSYINLSNKPPLYKAYPGVSSIPLPTTFPSPQTAAIDAVASAVRDGGPFPDIIMLSQILFFSAGVIRKAVLPNVGEVHYRAAASAGALYPIEIYAVCRDIPGLPAGIYHYSPEDFALQQLRQGDYRGELAKAAGGNRDIAGAPVTLVFSAIFWRTSWKYRVRGYRYCIWDNGTMLANLLAVASAAGLPAPVALGFVDERVNRLVGIDGDREASSCLVSIGKDSAPAAVQESVQESLEAAPVAAGALPPFDNEIDYPDIHAMHTATLLTTEAEASAWRGGLMRPDSSPGTGAFFPLQTPEAARLTSGKLGEVILGRGSTRRFSRQPIPYSHFNAIIDCSTRGISADYLSEGPAGGPGALLDTYLIVNAVADLPSGAYHFNARERGFELLQEGDFREEAGHLCFEQALGADAGIVVFFLADLERILGRFGNRGYRAAQLEAGIAGGKMYLCAYSLGLGASGITFYDDEITDFFSPHSRGKTPMFVVTLGIPARRNRVTPFRSRVAVKLDALARGAAPPKP